MRCSDDFNLGRKAPDGAVNIIREEAPDGAVNIVIREEADDGLRLMGGYGKVIGN